MENDQIIQLDPAQVQANPADNQARYRTKKLSVQSLADNIAEVGGVLQPVEVAELEKPVNGITHRIITGFTRHAAVTLLNASGAGLLLPSIVRDIPDELTALKHQLSENIARESMSPMDQAVAIKRLLDAGVERKEVMKIFSRPGGRKGLQIQPASNAYLNMTMSFLELPKAIQDKIDVGLVGVAAAYELTKVAPDKQKEVLEAAEAARQAAIDREERDEERFTKAEEKLRKAQEAEEQTAVALDNAKLEVKAATELVTENNSKAAEAYKALRTAQGEKDSKVAQEAFKAAQVDCSGSDKRLSQAKKALDKLQGQVKKLSDVAATHRDKLTAARKAAQTKAPAKAATPAAAGKVGAADVRKAAQGADPQHVPIKAAEMRKFIEDLCLPGTYKMVTEIAKVILEHFNGVTTPKEAYNQLAVLTGERAAAGNPRSAEMPKKPKK